MLEAAAGLAARGHDVVLAARPEAPLLDRAREAGLQHRAVHMRGDFGPRALAGVRRLLRQQRPHAVFVNQDRELRYLCWATLGSARPLVFQRAGSDESQSGWMHRWASLRCVTRTLTNGEAAAEDRTRLPEWMPQDRIRVMRAGVRTHAHEVPVTRNEVRRALRLPRRKPLVVQVGELQTSKGQDTTLEALALLRQGSANPARDAAVPNVAFVGTGTDEAPLRDRCHALGVQEHVLWVGFRASAERYLAAADVCVMPSRSETMPWSVLDAMAQGTPVVASALRGIQEIVEDGVNGLLIEPDDAPGLANAVRRLLEDRDLAHRLAGTALRRVHAQWSAEAMLDDLECMVLAELLRRRAAHRAAARPASRAALFVDRDDTLVHNVPYNGDPGAVRLLPGAGRALRWVRDAGIAVVVVTNQSGIALGLHDADDVRAVHARLRELLGAEGADVDALYFCPHHPDHGPPCDCRKPLPGLLLRALHDLGLSADESLMVGDSQRDLDAAHAANVPAAGLAAVGGEHDWAPGENVYTDWTTVVRDFLRARWAAARFAPRPSEAAPLRASARTVEGLESPTRSG